MEWPAFWLTISIALGVFVFAARKARVLAALVALIVMALAVGAQAMWREVRHDRDKSLAQLAAQNPKEKRTDGYVSSDACRSCHPDQYASWHRSYHRTMTQAAVPGAVRGNFDNVQLVAEETDTGPEPMRLDDDVRALSPKGHIPEPRKMKRLYSLSRKGDEYWVDIQGVGLRRISMLTGSHHMQAYWIPGNAGNTQVEFPFTYLFDDERWVPRRDVFLISPRFPKNQAAWNQICVECHATASEPGIDKDTRVPTSRVAELGIACESCHGPGGPHIERNMNPARRFYLHMSGKEDDSIVNPARLSAPLSAQVCGQCHGISCNLVGWEQHGLKYKPGQDLEQFKPVVRVSNLKTNACAHLIEKDPTFVPTRYWSDGMPRTSGREYNSLVESPCFKGGKLSCLSCHTMHGDDPNDQLAKSMEGDRACMQCHADAVKDIPAHTKHKAGSSGSLCYNCHMPMTTYGLMTAMRSHTVSSPNVASTVETRRPNACNLCHLDKSLGWTAGWLDKWWGTEPPSLDETQKNVSAAAVALAKGDAGERALYGWHMSWPPAMEASGKDWQAPHLARLFDDEYAAVRYIAGKSLRSMPGFADFKLDFIAAETPRIAARDRALGMWKPAGKRGREVLLGPDGFLKDDYAALRANRHDDEMFLAE